MAKFTSHALLIRTPPLGLSSASLVLVALLLASGCQSTQVIDATALPSSYRVGNAAYKPPIDLSLLARESVSSDLIYPGDFLDVTLVTGAESEPPEPRQYRVDDQGQLDIRDIGPVYVAGATMPEAERLVRAASIERKIFRDPTVSIVLHERKTDHVRVVGAVENPDVYQLPSAGNDLLAAIVKAGGLKEEAGTTIEIRHPSRPGADASRVSYETSAGAPAQQFLRVDLYEAMQGRAGDLRLRDGSVVHVQQRVPQKIYVDGLVTTSGEYELPIDRPLRVSQAIATAGGRKLQLADTVHVTRRVPGQDEPVVIKVSMKEAKSNSAADLVLAPDDVVSVEETPLTFTVETLRNFFRFGFSTALPGL